MKLKRKSSLIKPLLALACMAGLAGCSAIDWPHVFGGNEVPKAVANAPTPIERPPPQPSDSGWLRLGDVPGWPRDFTPPAVSTQVIRNMKDQRARAREIRQQMEPSDMPLDSDHE